MPSRPIQSVAVVLVAVLTVAIFSQPLSAQVRGQAIVGEPFGVAQVELPVDRAGWQELGRGIFDADGRVFYPVFVAPRERPILNNLLGMKTVPRSVTAYFLFQGSEPLRIDAQTPLPASFSLRPIDAPGGHAAMLQQWRAAYLATIARRMQTADHPPSTEVYLASMLCGRLGLAPPTLAELGITEQSQPRQTLELISGAEKLRAGKMLNAMTIDSTTEVADRPMPAPHAWPTTTPGVIVAGEVEPIATRVPVECFYVRFGSYENYRWLDRLLNEYGGDIQQMITLRGYNYRVNDRIQKQLCFKTNDLREMFGGKVIEDVAMIGRDMYVHEGAAIGILFKARSTDLMKTDLLKQRREIVKEHGDPAAKNRIVEIAGHKVSYVSTPDNQLRSYYAIDGEYHLVTTSRAIVERFFETGDGIDVLAESPDFIRARGLAPLAKDYTAFVYLSSPFFQQLVSPRYEVELNRRLQALAYLEAISIAKRVAKSEGSPAITLEELIAAGYLPAGFGRQADGSGSILEENQSYDSLRGRRGFFTPIPDLPLTSVTAREEATIHRSSEFYRSHWTQMDPLMVAVRRFATNETGGERLLIDANVSPFEEEKYGWVTSILGPPLKSHVTPSPGDIIHVQASVRGGLLLPSIPPHHLFGGVEDAAPFFEVKPENALEWLFLLRSTPGYLGAWPKPGFLDLLPIGLLGRRDGFGFTQMLFGLWRWEGRGFSVLSFHRDLLARVSGVITPAPTEDPAQIRIAVGDLSRSSLRPLINGMAYERSRQVSVGNALFLQTLTNQLHISQDEALKSAEEILDAELVCTVGGKFELKENVYKKAQWQSSAWTTDPARVIPADFEAPALTWFRGLQVGLNKTPTQLKLHAELDIQRRPTDPKPKAELPVLDLLKRFTLGGGKKPKDDPARKPDEPIVPELLPTPAVVD